MGWGVSRVIHGGHTPYGCTRRATRGTMALPVRGVSKGEGEMFLRARARGEGVLLG
jgi:hypothetical protein